MRTYLILKEKVAHFNADQEIQALITEINGKKLELPGFDIKFSPESLKALKGYQVDRAGIGAEGLQYEKLDQLTCEILFGVR
ncbi:MULTISPECIES: hypothetical protein [unclassified Paenibacillus]|uniref:hypothetical protein n=1 Tax=unclassified Paenibacillus TaxID=185978 RepID=UPI001B6E0339|nr:MULTISPECIES: hypothetical protein [unclassified Paenibacillus]MBP1157539.1 hypothetical protein [Paenibacillus sp. PvP091]MBP1171724.1 hypothetical protein [Paenibacillus sp. PvR098]MBP2438105.1 hypothetical protein [Paenibacillus sp. PvP052]